MLPSQLHADFLTYKHTIDLTSPLLTQGALEIYLKSNMYKFHVLRTKSYYQRKMDVLRAECRHQKNDILQWHIPATGIYAYAEVIGISADVLVNRLSQQGVLVSSITNSYIDNFQHPEGLRICVCNTDDNTIRSAVKLIEQEAKSLNKKMTRSLS